MLRYRLDDLGWYQFEQLVQTLLKIKLGLGIESWGGHGDHGRDANFEGCLEFPKKGESSKGSFVFQAKFVENANAAGAKPYGALEKAVNSEMEKISTKQTIPDQPSLYYTLLTNVPLPASKRKKLVSIIRKTLPLGHIVIMAGGDLCDWLDDTPNIRQSFPQLLSLRDLNEILARVIAKPIFERSTLLIEQAGALTKVFVATSAYTKALNTLYNKHFLVLVGAPEVGKTTIARIIGFAQMSLGKVVYECRNPDEFFQVYARERPQLYIADDAFGSTEYDPTSCLQWSRDLEKIFSRLDSNHWFIWTTRAHILAMALDTIRLQGKAENFPQPGDILVDAEELSNLEKALILYRHAKAKSLDQVSKRIIQDFAMDIVENPSFTPERIRRFVSNRLQILVSKLQSGEFNQKALKEAIAEEINEPTKSMKQAFNCLSHSHKILLCNMLESSYLDEISDIKNVYDKYAVLLRLEPFSIVLTQLSETFVKVTNVHKGGEARKQLSWLHPSLRSIVIDYLRNDIGARHCFLQNCNVEGIKLALAVNDEFKEAGVLICGKSDLLRLRLNITKNIAIIVGEARVLFEILENNLMHQEEKSTIPDAFFDDLKNFMSEVLATLSGFLNEQKICVNLHTFKSYYSLATKLKVPITGLDLTFTWQEMRSKVQRGMQMISERNYLVIGEYNSVEKLLDFVHFIEENNPSFLPQMSFPSSLLADLAIFIDSCIDLSEWDAYDLIHDDPDLVMSDIENLECLIKILNDLCDYLPCIRNYMPSITAKLAKQREYMELRLMDDYPGAGEEFYSPEMEESRSVEDISSIFDDL
jgi:hypothetical protein